MTIMTNKGTFTKAAVLTSIINFVRENGVDTTYHGVAEDGVEYDVPASDVETTLTAMLAQLEKPRATKDKPENEADRMIILAYLRDNSGNAYSATEILVATANQLEGKVSNQRVSYLLKNLAEDGLVEKTTFKRNVTWRAIVPE